jgi:cell division protein FtsB
MDNTAIEAKDVKKSKVAPKLVEKVVEAEKIEASDFARLEVISLKQENVQLKIASLKSALDALNRENAAIFEEMKAKYSLSDGDSIDPKTLDIIRKK